MTVARVERRASMITRTSHVASSVDGDVDVDGVAVHFDLDVVQPA
jgi:hypothetical protein